MNQPKTYAPAMEMDNTSHLQQTLRFKDPQNPDAQEMPQKQHIVLKFFFDKEEASTDPDNFGTAEVIGNLMHQVNFTKAEAGKTVYYRCCYINYQSEKSPWSEILSVVVV